MTPADLLPDLVRHIPGPLGSATSMLFMRDLPRLHRACFAVAGCALAHYLAPLAAAWAEMPEGPALYLVGLFGMTAVRKLFSSVEALDLVTLLRRAIARLLGVTAE